VSATELVTVFGRSLGTIRGRIGCHLSWHMLGLIVIPLLLLTPLLMLLLTPVALAQSSVTVTDADIERVQRTQPVITEQDIERARKKYRMPSEAELRSVPLPSTPNIGALPQPKVTKPLDLEAIAKGFEANTERIAQTQGMVSGAGLLVFVSFSMPEATLQRLVDQAARAKASLVLRGFVNGSLQETVLRVQRLIGNREVAFQIDPQAFDRFAIGKTPSFVLVRDGAQAKDCASGLCFADDAFVVTAGDVSLDYALESIQRSAPGFAKGAAGFLDRIRSGR
jgi:conjugal transfer pilus assembly protein TrbC